MAYLSVRKEFVFCSILILVIFWIYFPVANYDFITSDDPNYVVENYNVQNGISLNSIRWAFFSFHAGNWHPVTWISHMIDCQLYGLDPGKHHSINLIFHSLNSVLLFIVLLRATDNFICSSFVSFLFAVHPTHVESVAWIAERKDVLSTFFMMLTFICYISYTRSKNKIKYYSSVIFFALGLMSKPMLVTLPFLLILFDYWPLERFNNNLSPKVIIKKKRIF